MMKTLTIASKGLAVIAAGTVILLGASFGPTLIGYESFIVTSGSMGKANPIGSVAVTRMVDVKAIRERDVVSFQTESASRITHRVIEVQEEEGQRVFTTKGDANPQPDPEPLRLAAGRIARVEWSVPYAGHLVKYARTPVGGMLLFVVPILGLILDKRGRTPRRSAKAPSSGNRHSGTLASALHLACPHCGEGVAVSLVPLRDMEPNDHQPYEPDEASHDHIVIPDITWPEPEVESIDDSSDIEIEQTFANSDYREWNFPPQLSGAESSEKGGSRHA